MIDPPAPPAPRNPVGWIALALLFAFLIFNATSRTTADTPAARIARYENQIQTAMTAYDARSSGLSQVLNGEAPEAGLRRLERETAARRKEPIAATVWATVRRQLGEAVTEEDLRPLRRDPAYRIYADALAPTPPKNPASLAAALEKRAKTAKPTELGGAVAKTAADVVRHEAGLPIAKKAAIPRVAILLIGGVILASGLTWTATILLGLSGMLQPKGPAGEPKTAAVADAYAVKAAVLFVAFYALGMLGGQFGKVAAALATGGMLLVVPSLLRKDPSMAEVGFHGRNLARDVALGFWMFLLEIPVTLVLSLASVYLLRNLPPPSHPATNLLSGSPDLLTIALTLFSGVIVAPFWEETVFRGLLFPAIRRFTGPMLAALVSSFLFAAIHPQGPVLWVPLACVGLASCLLAQTTRSLVPSVVMHFAHNGVLMMITIWVAR